MGDCACSSSSSQQDPGIRCKPSLLENDQQQRAAPTLEVNEQHSDYEVVNKTNGGSDYQQPSCGQEAEGLDYVVLAAVREEVASLTYQQVRQQLQCLKLPKKQLSPVMVLQL